MWRALARNGHLTRPKHETAWCTGHWMPSSRLAHHFLLLRADGAVLVPVPHTLSHHARVEAADLVAVAVRLEEEASATRTLLVAVLLAVLDRPVLAVRTAVLRVGIADSVAAVVSQGDLAVALAVDEVGFLVAAVGHGSGLRSGLRSRLTS